jgi:hypothetical protein
MMMGMMFHMALTWMVMIGLQDKSLRSMAG